MDKRIGRCALAGAFAAFAGFSAAASAALTCEQLFVIAESAIQQRDQGHSLQQVLAGLKDQALVAKLTAEELQVLHKTVTAVYLGNATAGEIALACKEAAPKK